MRKRRITALLLALLLLCGCGGVPDGDEGQDPQTNSGQPDSRLSVYAGQEYRYALQQVFSHITMADSSIKFQWSDGKAEADVVITDCVPEHERSEYMVLDTQKLETQGIDALVLRTGQGVIGLPVFLRLDGLWHDRLFYSEHSADVPQSADAWLRSPLAAQYPAVCGSDSDSIEALFWGIAAPLYISFGGTEEELAAGAFRADSMQAALEQLDSMVQAKTLMLAQEAREKFTSTEAGFWVAGMGQAAKYYNYKSNLSQWGLSLSVPFYAEQKPQTVVRADMLLIRNTVEPAVAERFLSLFYENDTLTDLSEDTRMPMACQIRYTPSMVPELAQTCYRALSSPATALRYVICGWSEETKENVESVMLGVLCGEINAAQGAQRLSED